MTAAYRLYRSFGLTAAQAHATAVLVALYPPAVPYTETEHRTIAGWNKGLSAAECNNLIARARRGWTKETV